MSGDIAVANRLAVQGYIAEVPSIIYPFVFCRIIVVLDQEMDAGKIPAGNQVKDQ